MVKKFIKLLQGLTKVLCEGVIELICLYWWPDPHHAQVSRCFKWTPCMLTLLTLKFALSESSELCLTGVLVIALGFVDLGWFLREHRWRCWSHQTCPDGFTFEDVIQEKLWKKTNLALGNSWRQYMSSSRHQIDIDWLCSWSFRCRPHSISHRG